MKIFFSVGEPSGDLHTAHLITEFNKRVPQFEAVGYGGPKMAEAGCDNFYLLTNLAVMGIFQVIPLIGKFLKLVYQAGKYFKQSPPDAVVLVDFSGFNWWIARKAKAAGIPVFYYMPPQLWAWAPKRIWKVRKFVDHVLCGHQFEYEWYRKQGIDAHFVGHPFFDEVAHHPLDTNFVNKQRSAEKFHITVLPGSRNQEVQHNFPAMLQVMQQLHQKHSHVKFLVANFKESQKDVCVQMLQKMGVSLPITFEVGKTSECIEASDCCLMCSGSVSLELLARNKPAVVIYCLSRLSAYVLRKVLTIDHLTLTNLIAGKRLMPEFIIGGSPAPYIQEMTESLSEWVAKPEKLNNVKKEMAIICSEVAQTGATTRAAETILSLLNVTEASISRAA
ncbi:Lipid-A-disaccharide synthase [hydrothermal vent metagenome]|uniref:lipid-A-disaccharide synthase n=1 Tax=hydrothermal vent metagenome TaxID=652676 RepID=A0A3B1DB36_9ZZZZ